ncbi:MAG: hypothetical protein US89_C0008G0017 [Candidatus Peregrinibacteria bacterium GW2011_GWF2_38_29]|nr:MAG: hypothetical protein US89_C0008G0017 [Candidatus Peregrinibacteria bacterium GW2011_GWF2_38_29]HBB03172.1 hypothetical protein [Candidatus Peregrinibacteria bacterium]
MIDQILKKYESLGLEIERSCASMCQKLTSHPCLPKCSDEVVCCKQIFPLCFVEAYYISLGVKKLDRSVRRDLERHAEKSQTTLIKHIAEFNSKSDTPIIKLIYPNTDYETHNSAQQSITKFLHSQKTDCPFLDKNLCQIYPHRNTDCRIHGFAYDKNTNEILGCHRHKEIFSGENRKKFEAEAIPHNFMYKEKIHLDASSIFYLTGDEKYRSVRYLTTPFMPILRDYSTFDWNKFFTSKLTPKNLELNSYSLVFDFEV